MIQILDTTLRDGAQAEGIVFSQTDKMRIVQALDELGVRWIEAGNPGSNPADEQFFASFVSAPPLRNASLVAFGSTHRPYILPEEDESLKKLAACPAEVKSIFGKASLKHVHTVLRCEPEENLRMIRESITFLRSRGSRVWFDAEHFFDGYRDDPDYALKTLLTAQEAGADFLILCDTNGGTFPEEAARIVRETKAVISVPLGIHGHNDCGLACALSLAAVQAGCEQVQGTIGGVGERCGNTDLCTLIPLLQLKLSCACLPEGHLNRLTHLSRVICEIMNIVPNERAPFVGNSAFAHKAGMHIDGIMKDPSTYEQVDPESVGNQRRFLLSDQVGRAGVYARLGRLMPDLNRNSPEIRRIIQKLKDMESLGYAYENADGSFELMALDTLGRRRQFFEVVDYHVLCQPSLKPADKKTPTAQAYLKIRVGGKEGINAAEGEGPVNALDIALRKTLSLFFPSVSRISLQDFKVRVLDTQGTASSVRVALESTDGTHIWNTVGVSDNIIEASLRGLVDSVDYFLTNFVPENELEVLLQSGNKNVF